MDKKKKRKWLISGLIIIVLVIVAVFVLRSEMIKDQKFNEEGEVDIQYKSTYVDAVPEEFKTKSTEKMAAEMFNIDSVTGDGRKSDTLELNAKLIPDGDFYKAEGNGILNILGKNYPFDITSAHLEKETLKSGDHLIWGSLNGNFTDVKGIERELILNMSTVIETEEVFYYATLGGVIMSYGDLGFETKEIRDIILRDYDLNR